MYISLLGYFCDADLSPEVRFCLVHYAFVCLVILVSEEDVPVSLCESVWIHSKSMVLSSDVAAACSLVCAWLVVTTVTISNEKCKYICTDVSAYGFIAIQYCNLMFRSLVSGLKTN